MRITDVPCQCTCGWSGTVYDCEPDVDGDGNLGCPKCNKVIVTQLPEMPTNQQENIGPQDISQLFHIYRQAKGIVNVWNEFGPEYLEERISGIEQAIKVYERWQWGQLSEDEQRRLGLPCGHPYKALYSTGFTSYCRECEAQAQKDIEILRQLVK